MRGVRVAATVVLLAGVTFACAKKNDENANAPADTAMAQPAPANTAAAAPAGAPTDAQIAHIAVTANDIDIDHGKDAKGRTKNAEVKAFAERMITDHTGVNDKAAALAKKLNLTPEDNPTSQALKAAGDSAKTANDKLSGADFDKAYISNEVAYHQNVLNALDQTLIPNAQNAELKALLQQVRPAVDAHLKMAQQIQAKLK